jgi:hypothetical protein
MGDDEKAPEKPVRDARVLAAAGLPPGIGWWPASRLMLDMIKQG